jgi:serine/threonine protein kinase
MDLGVPVNVKIGDFGLSRWCPMPLHEFLPTWQWLAPEIFMCGFYDETSDIYSYGMVMYEIIYRYARVRFCLFVFVFFVIFLELK